MPADLRKPLYRASCVFVFCAGLAACASVSPTDAPSLTKATPVAPVVARDAVVAGKSTKRDVLATLGKTATVVFDSGYEVWVYHLRDAQGAGGQQSKSPAEFVVLFNPAGVATKTRIRPTPLPSPQGS